MADVGNESNFTRNTQESIFKSHSALSAFLGLFFRMDFEIFSFKAIANFQIPLPPTKFTTKSGEK